MATPSVKKNTKIAKTEKTEKTAVSKKAVVKAVPVNELRDLVSKKREALRAFRFSVSGGKVKNVREGRALRKEIARALTSINKI